MVHAVHPFLEPPGFKKTLGLFVASPTNDLPVSAQRFDKKCNTRGDKIKTHTSLSRTNFSVPIFFCYCCTYARRRQGGKLCALKCMYCM